MANRLKVAKVFSIKQLHDQGWSQRRISRELGISRDAVTRQLRKVADSAESIPHEGVSNKAASEKAPTGSRQHDGPSNQATPPTGHRPGTDRRLVGPPGRRLNCQPIRRTEPLTRPQNLEVSASLFES